MPGSRMVSSVACEVVARNAIRNGMQRFMLNDPRFRTKRKPDP
jgi:hypothetical protein